MLFFERLGEVIEIGGRAGAGAVRAGAEVLGGPGDRLIQLARGAQRPVGSRSSSRAMITASA